ncbi:hypothetical protein CH299_28610 [Rhodococcus sp. 14-2686-1-2]|nr:MULTISPECIES: hypothetical protein [unclassified Rhodococcus (in: high G+C Gram-positive bacteria)]OZE92878.1 hypothetical protein CH301_28095 [Rhodococcus sp. 15-1189-1-1a]OZF08133.1 hypothetical protein CH299_28610 [Rhodococcus sp. 14-2686-1-2]
MTTSAATEWEAAAAAVRGAADDLRTSDSAALRAWAKTNDLLSRTMWPKVKRELLKQLDLDYDSLRNREAIERRDAIAASAASAPLVELFAAGDERGSFAVVGPVDDAAWYGTFHRNDAVFKKGNQDSADDSAAGKAIFLAGKAREEADVPAVRLLLHISNPNIDGTALAGVAAKHGVSLDLDITDDNPAAQWCEEPGFQAWQAIRLSDLFVDDEETDDQAPDDQ